MATLYIDNVPYEVKDGQNLLHACLSLGFDVPYFCWHPALGSVGACRQCAVKQFKDENDTRGRIVMSCMTPVTDGMRISIDDAEVRAFRARVIEWLMKNHPHDCPICDEGGECHLQDMTVMSGHTARRYRFTKRTHNNQNLGPFLNHEMNRCIQCYRCVRFYREYAGGRDLNAFASHDNVYFGRHEDGTLENEFSGNLAEICPTGVFTDKTFKQHFTRAWDLQVAPSVCVHCGLGCNVIPGERYGEVRRIRNRYNGAVNGYFLCDRGRYGYAFLSAESRIRQVSRKPARSAAEETTAKDAALKLLGRLLRDAKGVIGIGSPRASLESNFALRALAGPDAFFTGLSAYDNRLADAALAAMREGPVPVATLQEVGMADAVFVLGEDLVNTAPLAALRLRQAVRIQPMAISRKLRIPDWDENAVREAVQDARGPLFIASAAGTGLDVLATRTYSAAPDDLARLGFAVAHALDPNAPAVPGLSGDMAALADEIAQALASAKRPLVISGASAGSASVVQAAAQAARALHTRNSAAMLFITAPECNSVGLALLGGGSLEEAQQRIVSGAADTVIVVENDLYRRADKALVDELLDTAKCVVVLDHTLNPTVAKADIVLPAAAFADGDGTLVNNEGRAQRFFQVYMPDGDICESWRWLGEVARAAGRAQDAWSALDGIQSAMAAALPVFEGVLRAAPRADERFAGQRLPRQPHRYSGRTSMRAHLGVSEPGIPNDPDSLFTFSMEGFRGAVPGSVLASTWKPGWNSVQSVTKSQEEAGGSLCGGDPGVRLIEPREGQTALYSNEIPGANQRRDGEFLAVAAHHIFGSEELSSLAPAIAGRAHAPYVALNPEDAQALGVKAGDSVMVTVGGGTHTLPVQTRPALPRGAAALPAGLPDGPCIQLPAPLAIERGATA